MAVEQFYIKLHDDTIQVQTVGPYDEYDDALEAVDDLVESGNYATIEKRYVVGEGVSSVVDDSTPATDSSSSDSDSEPIVKPKSKSKSK